MDDLDTLPGSLPHPGTRGIYMIEAATFDEKTSLQDFVESIRSKMSLDVSKKLDTLLDAIEKLLNEHHNAWVDAAETVSTHQQQNRKSKSRLSTADTFKWKSGTRKSGALSTTGNTASVKPLEEHLSQSQNNACIGSDETSCSNVMSVSRDPPRSNDIAAVAVSLHRSERDYANEIEEITEKGEVRNSIGEEPEMLSDTANTRCEFTQSQIVPSGSVSKMRQFSDTPEGAASRRASIVRRSMSDTSKKRAAGVAQPVQNQVQTHIHAQVENLQKVAHYDQQESRLKLVQTPLFSTISAIIILLNMIYIGVQCDQMVKAATRQGVSYSKYNWLIGDVIFVVIFTVEIGLRWVSAGTRRFCCGRERRWNIFDVMVVIGSIIDLVLEASLTAGAGLGLRLFRSFRLFRLIRVLRAGKHVPLIRHLKIMIFSLYGCVTSFMPAIILLIFVMYMFGIGFLQGVAEYLETVETRKESLAGKTLIAHYGSLGETLWTLLSAISGGADWATYADPLLEIGLAYKISFLAYICVVMFGLLNVLHGIFVHVAISSCNMSRDIVTEANLREGKNLIKNIVEAFIEADADRSGTLSFEEFQTYMLDEQVRAYFTSLDIDVMMAERIFDLLDDSDDGQVDLVEFVQGCLSHRGHATAIDSFFLERATRECLEGLSCIQDKLRDLEAKCFLIMSKAASPS